MNFLQASNADLQNKLYQLKEKEKKTKEDYVNPEELRQRLDQLIRGIKSGKVCTVAHNIQDTRT